MAELKDRNNPEQDFDDLIKEMVKIFEDPQYRKNIKDEFKFVGDHKGIPSKITMTIPLDGQSISRLLKLKTSTNIIIKDKKAKKFLNCINCKNYGNYGCDLILRTTRIKLLEHKLKCEYFKENK